MKAHFQMMAAYNAWANGRLYAAAARLPAEDLRAGMGVAFGSLSGTLNHLLIADMLWLARFRAEIPPDLPLDGVVHDALSPLRKARAALDSEIVAFVDVCDLGMRIAYANTAGERFEQPLAQLLAHIFNHQTHHRGQCHAILTRLTGEAPPLDLIYYLRDV